MKKLIPLVLTLVVGIILAGSVLMPVIEDATKSISGAEYNDQTDDSIRMSYGTPSDNLKVEKPAGEALISMYLGESETPYYTFPLNTDGYVAWALVTSTFSYGITGGDSNTLIDYTARTTAGTGESTHYGLSTAFTVHLNVTTGVITVDRDGTAITRYAPCDVERVYWADPNGDYVNVVTRGSHPPIYLEDPKDIIGSLMIGGNYAFWQTTDNVEVTKDLPATVTTTTTTQENGLYVLDKISYEVTGTDANVRTGEMGHCIVKYQVVGNTMSGSDAVISLIQTLPILVIVALVVAAVGAVTLKRD